MSESDATDPPPHYPLPSYEIPEIMRELGGLCREKEKMGICHFVGMIRRRLDRRALMTVLNYRPFSFHLDSCLPLPDALMSRVVLSSRYYFLYSFDGQRCPALFLGTSEGKGEILAGCLATVGECNSHLKNKTKQ